MFESRAAKRRMVRKLITISGLVAVSVLLAAAAMLFPAAFFSVYTPLSRGLSGAMAFVFSFARFSVAEFLLYGLVLVFLVFFVLALVGTFTRTEGPRRLLGFGVNCVFTAAVLAFLYIFLWGLNYYAPAYEGKLGITVRQRPEEALVKTADWLLSIVEEEAGQVPRGAFGQTDAGGMEALADMIPDTYGALIAENEFFAGGGVSPPKRVTNWLWMTYAGIAGIYMPLTGESNVNPDAIDAYLPSTMAHEVAHRFGFAREEDASYIAFRACMVSPYPVYRYSGALCALISCLNAITDGEELNRLYDALPQGVWDDFSFARKQREEHELDEQLAETVSSFASDVNDAYLQTMGQKDGVKSYGRVVDLLIADYVSRFGEVGLS